MLQWHCVMKVWPFSRRMQWSIKKGKQRWPYQNVMWPFCSAQSWSQNVKMCVCDVWGLSTVLRTHCATSAEHLLDKYIQKFREGQFEFTSSSISLDLFSQDEALWKMLMQQRLLPSLLHYHCHLVAEQMNQQVWATKQNVLLWGWKQTT